MNTNDLILKYYKQMRDEDDFTISITYSCNYVIEQCGCKVSMINALNELSCRYGREVLNLGKDCQDPLSEVTKKMWGDRAHYYTCGGDQDKIDTVVKLRRDYIDWVIKELEHECGVTTTT